MLEDLKTFFLAHAGETYAPSVLQRIALGVMAFLTIMSFALANAHALLWLRSDWLVSTILPAVIVDLTNEERTEDTEAPLLRSMLLDEAARMKAEHMAAHSYFAHYSPDGISPWYWFDEAGYSFIHAGENLAVLFTDSEDVVDAWMDSPGHKANILSGDYTEIGVGTAKVTYKGKETVFVVQLFGTPAEVAEREIVATVPILGPTGLAETVIVESSVGEEVAAAEASAVDVDIEVAEEPAIIESDLLNATREETVEAVEPTSFARLLTQPANLLQYAYSILAVFVVLLLIASLVLAFRKRETLQVVYGTGLLLVMVFLLVVHAAVTGGAVIL